MIFAGIIQGSGVFCLREPLRYRLFRRGRNSCAGALSIASPSIASFHKRREAMRNCEGRLTDCSTWKATSPEIAGDARLSGIGKDVTVWSIYATQRN
jgi:hypothetical protein